VQHPHGAQHARPRLALLLSVLHARDGDAVHEGLAVISPRHPTHLNPCSVNHTASYDMAANICQTHDPSRLRHAF
jgi:hypothetical protein